MGFEGSYLWQLRQKLGTQRLLTPGVAIIVVDAQGKILCGKRTAGGEWSYIGGGLELGQSVLEALQAELMEETGISLKSYRFAGICSHPARTNYTYPNGDEVQVLNMVFEVSLDGQSPRLDEEHTEFGFFDINDLPQPFKSDSVAGVDIYRRYLQTGVVQID